MSVFDTIIALSKSIAKSLLKNEKSNALEQSDIFTEQDKAYILESLTQKSAIESRIKLKKQINKKTEWEIVKKKINPGTTRKIMWQWAVAASVIGVLLVVFIRHNKIEENNGGQPNDKVVGAIEIGTDKAVLTLGDGKQIALESGKTFKTQHAESNGETLIYKIAKAAKAEYNYLSIPRGGQFHIKLSDGTQVWLNSETYLKYPVTFIEGKPREVELIHGEAYFSVTKGTRFKVLNANQEVQVLGTEFNIKAYRDENTIYTTLVEGSVEVKALKNTEKLKPNQQSKFNISSETISVSTIDVYNETSWKDGVFSFENMPLKDIMGVLSRWYDIDVVFENRDLMPQEFIGVLSKDQPIEEILKTIQNFGIIKSYQIHNKTVVLK
ncbi:MAG: FecR family protein [Flavobacteriaceae bacterium]